MPHIAVSRENRAQHSRPADKPFEPAATCSRRTAVRVTPLNGTQKFSNRAPSPVFVRVRFRAMAIDLIRLAGHDTEQLAEVLHKMALDVRRHAQSIKERSQMLWRRPAFVTANLPSHLSVIPFFHHARFCTELGDVCACLTFAQHFFFGCPTLK